MKQRLIGFLILLPLVLCGCGERQAQQEFYAMDTYMSITAYGKDPQSTVAQCVQYINALEANISRTREDSELSAINAAEGKECTPSEQTMDILQEAFDLAQQTNGAFDPTIAPLIDLWQIGPEQTEIPAQADIDAAKAKIGYQRVKLTENSVQLEPDMKLDLGGIGKGYAADHVAAMLKDAGIKRALIALGGNIYVIGEKEKGIPWTAGITDPDDPQSYFATLSVTDTSIVTSGDYERYFEKDGKRYCHIFDPKTGYPTETDLRSVTVVMPESAKADAYSTALFVMGYDAAKEYCEQNGIQAVLVRNDHTVYASDGLECSITNTEYHYET